MLLEPKLIISVQLLPQTMLVKYWENKVLNHNPPKSKDAQTILVAQGRG